MASIPQSVKLGKSRVYFRKAMLIVLLTVIGSFSLLPNANSAPAGHVHSLEKTPAPTHAKSATAHQHGESGEADKPHTLAASLYRIGEKLNTTLTLNNKGPRPLEVRPTLYNVSGERLEIPPVTVEANSHSIIDLREWAERGGEVFLEGSMQLFYRGNDLLLGAQVKMMDEAESLMFDEQLVEPAMMFKSSRLEGVWWLPSQESQVEMCFSNTTDLPLTIVVSVRGTMSEEKIPFQVTLQPHETRVTGLQDLVTKEPDLPLPAVGGISIAHQGQPGALLARGMVQEPAKGFSSAIRFVDPATLKSTMLNGTGLRLGQIVGDELRPVVAAYNISDAAAVISGRVHFTRDGGAHSLTIGKVRLRAGESKLLPLKPAIRRLKAEDITSAGLEFQYKGKPGSVIMSALSLDTSGNQVYQVPMLDPAAQKSSTGGYPWRIEGTSSTMVYIMNTTDRLQHYTAYLKVAGGDYVIGTNMLDSGQTATYDIRALRDNQVKDRDGHTIPIDATSGQFYWSIIQAESGPTQRYMIGRAEQMDQAKGMSSSYACQNCCNMVVADYGITPTNMQTVVGNTVSFLVWQDNYDCNGNIYPSDPPSFTVSWSSSNKNIAKMNGNVATAKSAGTVTINAQWNAGQTSPPLDPNCGAPLGPQNPDLPDPCACSSDPRHITVNATLVVSPSVTISGPNRVPLGTDVNTIQLTATGNPTGGTYTWSTTSAAVTLTNTSSATVTVRSVSQSSSQNDVTINLAYTLNVQTAHTLTTVTVQNPTSLTKIGTDSTAPLAACATNQCGVTRTFDYQVADQFGNPIQVAGMQFWDSLVNTSTNTCNLQSYNTTCSPPNTGPCGVSTSTTGTFNETLRICTPRCHLVSGPCADSGCTTIANQTWSVNGVSLGTDVKQISYRCQQILVNGQ